MAFIFGVVVNHFIVFISRWRHFSAVDGNEADADSRQEEKKIFRKVHRSRGLDLPGSDIYHHMVQISKSKK